MTRQMPNIIRGLTGRWISVKQDLQNVIFEEFLLILSVVILRRK